MLKTDLALTDKPAAVAPAPAASPARPLILHYHLFKNAGTSLDRTLRANFGAAWDNFEGDKAEVPAADVRAHLLARPWIAVLSSHRAVLPPPELPGTTIIPVLFVRHPLDRIRSIYEFEHKQVADTIGANKAKETDLAGYIDWRVNKPGDRSIVNFQTYLLAKGGAGPSEIERAIDAARKLPFVGLVEAYDRSLERLEALLIRHFPRVKLASHHVNVTSAHENTLEERLAALREAIGDELYARVEAANQDDLRLWAEIRAGYQA